MVIKRLGPGLGDMVMLQPTIDKISNSYPVQVWCDYPDLFKYQYETQQHTETHVLDLGNPCPCFQYETSTDFVRKGRVQLFMETAGLQYRGEVPCLILSSHEIQLASSMRAHPIRIGLAPNCAKYGDIIDGWRDYPYVKELIQGLQKLGHIIWFHTSPPPIKVESFLGNIREMMIQIMSCDIVIAVDNGIAHITGALGVKLLGLFGPTDPILRIAGYPRAFWIPKYEGCGRAYCWYHPCKQRFCLSTVSPQSIINRTKILLNL